MTPEVEPSAQETWDHLPPVKCTLCSVTLKLIKAEGIQKAICRPCGIKSGERGGYIIAKHVILSGGMTLKKDFHIFSPVEAEE